jgi:quercetin dioxygenase-like cupin family protein
MNARTVTIAAITAVAAIAFATLAHAQAQDTPFRKEIKRTDLSGTNMEVIESLIEIPPGQSSVVHIHHGEEAFYVIEGGKIETANGKQLDMISGAGAINKRDVPHGGFKNVGDHTIKLLTVHVVDKGAPLYDTPPK